MRLVVTSLLLSAAAVAHPGHGAVGVHAHPSDVVAWLCVALVGVVVVRAARKG